MVTSFGQALKAKLIELEIATSDSIKGATEEQIEEIRLSQNASYLPATYRQFLMEMGQAAGTLYLGTAAFYSDVSEIREYARHLRPPDCEPFRLPDDAFVFLVHQGYQCMFFYVKPGDNDPSVFHYISGEKHPIEKWKHLSEFLTMFIADEQGTVEQKLFLDQYASHQ